MLTLLIIKCVTLVKFVIEMANIYILLEHMCCVHFYLSWWSAVSEEGPFGLTVNFVMLLLKLHHLSNLQKTFKHMFNLMLSHMGSHLKIKKVRNSKG